MGTNSHNGVVSEVAPCFLCFNTDNLDVNGPSGGDGFHFLTRYLNMKLSEVECLQNRSEILSMTPNTPVASSSSILDKESKIEFCKHCSKLMTIFRDLYSQHELMQLRLQALVNQIKEILQRFATSTAEVLPPSLVNLRDNTLVKCKMKLDADIALPKVSLKRHKISEFRPNGPNLKRKASDDSDEGKSFIAKELSSDVELSPVELMEGEQAVDEDDVSCNGKDSRMSCYSPSASSTSSSDYVPDDPPSPILQKRRQPTKIPKSTKVTRSTSNEPDKKLLIRCKICKELFKNNNACRKHIADLHTDHLFAPCQLECPMEASEFSQKLDAVLNEVIGITERQYTCLICETSVRNMMKSIIVIHVRKAHLSTISSKLAGSPVTSTAPPLNMNEMMETPEGGPVIPARVHRVRVYKRHQQCEYCPKAFINFSRLSAHISTAHTATLFRRWKPSSTSTHEFDSAVAEILSEFRVGGKCAICETIPRSCVEHIMKVHFDKVAASLRTLFNIPEEVEETSVTSEVCGTMSFFREVEGHEDLFECKVCQKHLLKESLGRHKRGHEKGTTSKRPGEGGDSLEGNVMCKICGQLFTNCFSCRKHIANFHTNFLYASCRNPGEDKREFQQSLKSVLDKLLGSREKTPSGKLRVTCTVCGLRSTRWNSMFHVWKHHFHKVASELGSQNLVPVPVDEFMEWRKGTGSNSSVKKASSSTGDVDKLGRLDTRCPAGVVDVQEIKMETDELDGEIDRFKIRVKVEEEAS